MRLALIIAWVTKEFNYHIQKMVQLLNISLADSNFGCKSSRFIIEMYYQQIY